MENVHNICHQLQKFALLKIFHCWSVAIEHVSHWHLHITNIHKTHSKRTTTRIDSSWFSIHEKMCNTYQDGWNIWPYDPTQIPHSMFPIWSIDGYDVDNCFRITQVCAQSWYIFIGILIFHLRWFQIFTSGRLSSLNHWDGVIILEKYFYFLSN